MIIKRIGPMSVAKIAGVLYAAMGFLIGAVLSVISLVGGAMGGSNSGVPGMLFGAAAVIALPIFYACIGVVGSLFGVAVFNLAAGWVGGVEIDTE